jgi:transposase
VLTDCLKQKFGSSYHEEDPKNISKEHFNCGGSLEDQKQSATVNCKKCSWMVDVNSNAAANLLGRYCERLGGDKNTVASRKKSKASKSLDKLIDNSASDG